MPDSERGHCLPVALHPRRVPADHQDHGVVRTVPERSGLCHRAPGIRPGPPRRVATKPIDTSHVQLPAALLDLIERLPEHNHDLWAKQRLADGWTYGPQGDNAKKQPPDLGPYTGLPDGEKEYDRIMATDLGAGLEA